MNKNSIRSFKHDKSGGDEKEEKEYEHPEGEQSARTERNKISEAGSTDSVRRMK